MVRAGAGPLVTTPRLAYPETVCGAAMVTRSILEVALALSLLLNLVLFFPARAAWRWHRKWGR